MFVSIALLQLLLTNYKYLKMKIILEADTTEYNKGIEENNIITQFVLTEECLLIKSLDINNNTLYLTEIDLNDAIELSKFILKNTNI